jgi:hypothetical protein
MVRISKAGSGADHIARVGQVAQSGTAKAPRQVAAARGERRRMPRNGVRTPKGRAWGCMAGIRDGGSAVVSSRASVTTTARPVETTSCRCLDSKEVTIGREEPPP